MVVSCLGNNNQHGNWETGQPIMSSKITICGRGKQLTTFLAWFQVKIGEEKTENRKEHKPDSKTFGVDLVRELSLVHERDKGFDFLFGVFCTLYTQSHIYVENLQEV